MYEIKQRVGNTYNTIYTTNSIPEHPVLYNPVLKRELNQAGSLEFAMVDDGSNTLYDSIGILETYLGVWRNSLQIFFGRVLNISESPITKQKTATVEGALAFLNDSEVPPDSKTKGARNGRTLTAEAFLTWCIEQHNAWVGEGDRRRFTLGNITHSKKNVQKKYTISGYTKTRDIIENELIEDYGGYLIVRFSEDGLTNYLDWVETPGSLNSGVIELRRNVISQQNAEAANDIFTHLLPVGKNGRTLPELTMELDPELTAKYGKIQRSVSFSDENTDDKLRAKAQEYLNKISSLVPGSATIKMVELRYLDGTTPLVELGDRFNNIEGFSGQEMLAFSLENNFETPQDDTVVLKNPKEAEHISSGSSGGGGSLSRASAGEAAGGYMKYKHIRETVEDGIEYLILYADQIDIDAQQGIKLNADRIDMLANEFTLTIGDLEESFAQLQINVDGLDYRMGNQEGRLSELQITLDGLNYKVEEQGGRLSEFEVNLDGMHYTLDDHEGRISNLNLTVDGFDYRISQNEERVSELNISLDGMQYRLSTVEGAYSQLQVDLDGMHYDLEDGLGRISQFEVRIDGIHQTVSDIEGRTATLESTTEGFRYRLDQDGLAISELKIDLDGLRYNLEDGLGRISQFEIRLDGMHQTVTDGMGRIATLESTTEGFRYRIEQDELAYSELRVTLDGLSHRVTNGEGRTSVLENTVYGLKSTVEDQNGSISTLQNTAEGLYHAVHDPNTGLYSMIQTEAGRISMVVDGNGNIKAGQIVLAINNGSSTALISADHIRLDGDTTLSGMLSIEDNGLKVSGPVNCSSITTNLTDGSLKTKSVQLVGASSSQGAVTYTLDAGTVAKMVRIAELDPQTSTLTLTLFDGTVINFSKATSVTLSGAWSSGSTAGTYVWTVTSSPLVASYTNTISYSKGTGNLTVPDTSTVTVDEFSSGGLAYVQVKSDRRETPLYQFNVDGSSIRQAGINSVKVRKGSWSSGIVILDKTTTASSGADSQTIKLTYNRNGVTWNEGVGTVRLWDGNGYTAQTGGVDTGYDVSIDLPTVTDEDTTWVNTSGNIWRADITIGGAVRSSKTKSFDYIRVNALAGVTLSETVTPEGNISDFSTNNTTISTSVTNSANSNKVDRTWVLTTYKNSTLNQWFAVIRSSSAQGGIRANLKLDITLSLGSLNTSTGKRTVSAKLGSETVSSMEISDYNTGASAVTLTFNADCWAFVTSDSSDATLATTVTNTITASTSAPHAQSKSVSINLSAGSKGWQTENATTSNPGGYYYNMYIRRGGTAGSGNFLCKYKVLGGDPYNAGLTAGRNEVKINGTTWSGGRKTFNKSVGTNDPKTVQLLCVLEGSGTSSLVRVKDGTSASSSADTGYTFNVGSVYTSGFNAAKFDTRTYLYEPGSDAAKASTTNTVTFKIDNGKTSDITFHVVMGTINTTHLTGYASVLRTSTSGPILCRIPFDASAAYNLTSEDEITHSTITIKPSTSNPSREGRHRVGSDISKSAMQANGYLYFTATCRGVTKKYYIGIKA